MAEKTFTTPSGAQVTESGLLVSGPPIYNEENLSAAPTFTLPEVSQGTSPKEMQAIVGSNADSLNKIVKSLQAQTLPEQNQSFFRKQILSDLEKIGGKTTRTLELEQASGIPEQDRRLQELTNQLNLLNAEAQAAQLKAEDMGETTSFVRGEQAQIERQRAVRALTIGAQAQAIQGNIALAQNQIDRAVTLEFEPAERRLKFLQEAYKFNQEDLTRTDKKRTEALNLLIGERERILNEQKAERSEILKIALKAAENGVSNLVLQGIQGAKTQEEALRIATEAGAMKEKGSAITLEDAAKFGLPTSLVGKSESELGRELDSKIPPEWFRELIEQKTNTSLTSQALSREWEPFRQDVLSSISGGGGLDFENL